MFAGPARFDAVPAIGRGAGRVRAASAADADRLARMFRRVFRGADGPADPRLAGDLRAILLDHPDRDERACSLAFERPDGDLGGFLGIVPVPMTIDGVPAMGAAVSTWMVEDRVRDSLAGTFLMRAHLRRGADVTFTDTANRISIEFQAMMRLKFAPCQSLQWVMPLNWGGYVAAVGARRAKIPAGAALVRAASALGRIGRPSRTDESFAAVGPRPVRAVAPGEFARIWLDCIASRRVRPAWGPERVEWILGEAARRPSLGDLRMKAVDGKNGAVGCVAYHADFLGRAICIAAVAKSGETEATMRAVFDDAEASGCVVMLGQADPALMEGLFRLPGVFYRHTSGALVGAKRPEIIAAFISGEGTLGGLVGDSWTPLATEAYSPAAPMPRKS